MCIRDRDKPFKDMFSTMAREMTSSGHLSVLNKYKQRTNSIWLNSLFSILIKYKEDAKKEDTLVNLRYLRTMIAQENALKRKMCIRDRLDTDKIEHSENATQLTDEELNFQKMELFIESKMDFPVGTKEEVEFHSAMLQRASYDKNAKTYLISKIKKYLCLLYTS